MESTVSTMNTGLSASISEVESQVSKLTTGLLYLHEDLSSVESQVSTMNTDLSAAKKQGKFTCVSIQILSLNFLHSFKADGNIILYLSPCFHMIVLLVQN